MKKNSDCLKMIYEDVLLLKSIFGNHLKRVALFGSIVNKNSNPNDIDLAIFISSLDISEVRNKILRVAEQLHFGVDDHHISLAYSGNSPVSSKEKTYDIVVLDFSNPNTEFLAISGKDLYDIAA